MRFTVHSKMKTFYWWWNHWFWITAIWLTLLTSLQQQQSTQAMPIPFSSLETISTSLKSALVQNDNTFQQTNDQQKIAAGSKPAAAAPMPFETSDTDDLHGGASEIDSERAAEWLVRPSAKNETADEAKVVSVKLEKSENIPNDQSVVRAFTLSNVNSTNATNTHMTPASSTTLLTSVTTTESNVMMSSTMIKATTTTQTTKLVRVHELPAPPSSPVTSNDEEHLLTVKSLSLSNSHDVTEANQSDLNDTVEIVMTDDESNTTEIAELSERKSKGLLGFSEEAAKVVNNISSRSTLQVSQSAAANSDDRLSSEALFDTDTDNGGIKMNAGIISVICVGIIGSLSAFSIMFVYVYRRRFLNNPPQALSEPDSSGYIDDSIRDNSDELYSLDNDSFLNSLEAMTIQNYWTDSVKHTKL